MDSNKVQTKKFKSPAAAATWINSRPHDIHVLALTPDGASTVLMFRIPLDRSSDRREIINDTIEKWMQLPIKERTGWPKDVKNTPLVVPLTKVLNSIRNLKPFQELTRQELSNQVTSVLGDLGYRLLHPDQSLSKYGSKTSLLIPKL